MSAPRITRANRCRLLIAFGIFIFTMGLMATFHNFQEQSDKLRHIELRCEQQQEVLTSQISNAENSLKLERANHQQVKHELVKKSKEEKESRDKLQIESNMKLSLQQHYKLLKSQHDDLVDSCAEKERQQLNKINDLQGKLKSVLSENMQIIRIKSKEIEQLKLKVTELENDMKKLLKNQPENTQSMNQLKNLNVELKHQMELMKKYFPTTAAASPAAVAENMNMEKKQILPNIISGSSTQHINVSKQIVHNSIGSPQFMPGVSDTNINNHSNNNISKSLPIKNNTNKQIVYSNNAYNNLVTKSSNIAAAVLNDGIINSVENFQFVPNVHDIPDANNDNNININNNNNNEDAGTFNQQNNILEAPNIVTGKNANVTSVNIPLSSSASSPISLISSSNSGNAVLKMVIPEEQHQQQQPQHLRGSSTTETVNIDKKSYNKKTHHRQLPDGVVPLEDTMNDFDVQALVITQKNTERLNNPANNNRYLNVLNDMVIDKKSMKNNQNNLNELDTGAREVNDNNDFLVDEQSHKDHLQNVILEDNNNSNNKLLGNNIHNNAAEEDTNIYDKQFNLIKSNEGGAGINLRLIEKSADTNANSNNNNVRLLNEIDADQGKVAYHDEEQLEEEDDDEYSMQLARKQESVVRT